jgi:death-on-curing protein
LSARELDYLTEADLLEIAAAILPAVRIRDAGLLASAAARPRTSVGGADAYPTLALKAAALLHSVARNHALVNGNKRLAWAAARAFCLLNDADITVGIDEAEEIVVGAAEGTLHVTEIAARLSVADRPRDSQ